MRNYVLPEEWKPSDKPVICMGPCHPSDYGYESTLPFPDGESTGLECPLVYRKPSVNARDVKKYVMEKHAREEQEAKRRIAEIQAKHK